MNSIPIRVAFQGVRLLLDVSRFDLRVALRSAVQERQWTGWIVTFVRSVARAATDATARAQAYTSAASALRARLAGPDGRSALGRRRLDVAALADLAFRRPYLSIDRIVDAGLARPRTAGRYLSDLQRLGLGTDVRWGRVRLLRISSLADALTSPMRSTETPRARLLAATLQAAAQRTPFVGSDDP